MSYSRWWHLFVSAAIAASSLDSPARDLPNLSKLPDTSAARQEIFSAPMELRHGIPRVKVMVNGRGPFTFILDTGTSCEAIVTPALAAQLKLPVVDRILLTDLGGHNAQDVDVVAVKTLTVAGVDFHAVQADVHEALTAMDSYDGILGFRLFRDKLLTLDYPQHRLLLSEGDSLQSGDPNVLPIEMSRSVPTVILAIGSAKVEAQIDSGGQGLCLPESIASSLKFAGRLDVIAHGHTQVSSFAIRGGTMQGQVEFAGHIFEKPFIEIVPIFPVADVGSAPLQDFAVSFDQRRSLVQFLAGKKTHRISPSWH
jgi:aspartyl protease